jgi:hypothetical protein
MASRQDLEVIVSELCKRGLDPRRPEGLEHQLCEFNKMVGPYAATRTGYVRSPSGVLWDELWLDAGNWFEHSPAARKGGSRAPAMRPGAHAVPADPPSKVGKRKAADALATPVPRAPPFGPQPVLWTPLQPRPGTVPFRRRGAAQPRAQLGSCAVDSIRAAVGAPVLRAGDMAHTSPILSMGEVIHALEKRGSPLALLKVGDAEQFPAALKRDALSRPGTFVLRLSWRATQMKHFMAYDGYRGLVLDQDLAGGPGVGLAPTLEEAFGGGAHCECVWQLFVNAKRVAEVPHDAGST